MAAAEEESPGQNLAELSTAKHCQAELSTTKQCLALQDVNDTVNDNKNVNENDNVINLAASASAPSNERFRYAEKKAINIARRGRERNTDYNALVTEELLEYVKEN